MMRAAAGASGHIIQFDHFTEPKRVKLRRKGNQETEWLLQPRDGTTVPNLKKCTRCLE
jgi:hypothetical protein